MNKVAKFAAIAMIAAPSFAFADDANVFEDATAGTTAGAGGQVEGSFAALGASGVAMAAVIISVIAVAASDGS